MSIKVQQFEGQQFVTADDIADELLTDTYDDAGLLREKIFRWMFRVWIDITRNFFKFERHVIISISKDTKVARIPIDSDGIIMLGYIDEHKQMIPMEINRNLLPMESIEDLRNHHCDKCKSVNLCGKITYSITNESVIIDGREYFRTISKIVQPDGKYYQEIKEPYLSYQGDDNGAIRFRVTESILCELQKDSCGCFPCSDKNISNLRNCGCVNAFFCLTNDMLPYQVINSHVGTYNIFEKEGYIQFSPNVRLDSVYIVYNSIALCKENVFYFPLGAQEALISGTFAKSIEKKKGMTLWERQYADKKYTNEKKKILVDQTKIPLQEIFLIFEDIPRIPTLQ